MADTTYTFDSILDTIKPLLGISPDDVSFDLELVLHINSVFMVLHQLGVSTSVFEITGNTETWEDFLPGGGTKDLSLIRSYIYLKVRLLFDPSSSGIVMASNERLITEMEERLVTELETNMV